MGARDINMGNDACGRHAPAVHMLSLVRDLQDRLEEAGCLSDQNRLAIDNVYYAFLATLPAKVAEEVAQG